MKEEAAALLYNYTRTMQSIKQVKSCAHTVFLLGFLGRGGKCRIGAEEGGHASRACVAPRGGSGSSPRIFFEISDAQRSHFMPSELNPV